MFRRHGSECDGLTVMDHQAFSSKFVTVCSFLREMIQAVQADPSLLGVFSIEDYTLFASFVKEFEWVKGEA